MPTNKKPVLKVMLAPVHPSEMKDVIEHFSKLTFCAAESHQRLHQAREAIKVEEALLADLRASMDKLRPQVDRALAMLN